jgi:nucleotide-binding universal stress UspA family protein
MRTWKGVRQMYTKILVASDGSGASIKAAEVGAEMAKAFSASLTVVTVAYVPGTYEDDLSADMREGYTDEWKHVLAATAKAAARIGVEPETKLLREGEPAVAILEEAEKGGYDMLIIGKTGAGSPASKVMGGVSRKIAEKAGCAVLVVR